MKIEIEKSEYDRLKSREEKLMAYYGWFVDKENDLATVEDIITKNIELEEENKRLKAERDMHRDAAKDCGYDIRDLEEDIKRLKSERDKWRGKYNRLKSEFNLLKNKIGTTQK